MWQLIHIGAAAVGMNIILAGQVVHQNYISDLGNMSGA